MKRTWNPSRVKRARKLGFRKKMATAKGRKTIAARRKKGRKKLNDLSKEKNK